jgi:hypothetical protein
VPEIRTLLARLQFIPPLAVAFVVSWSMWRRRHQAKAAIAHYKRHHKMQL